MKKTLINLEFKVHVFPAKKGSVYLAENNGNEGFPRVHINHEKSGDLHAANYTGSI